MYLNCHSRFSLRYGVSTVEMLLERAKEYGQTALALTDINNTSAGINFIRQARSAGIKPVVGIDFRNGVQQQFVGLAKNNEGFQELNTFLSNHLRNKSAIPFRAPAFRNCYIVYPFHKVRKDLFPLKKYEYIGIRLEDLKLLGFSPWKSQIDRLVLLQTVTVNSKREFNIHRLLRAIDNNTLLSKLDATECCSITDTMLPKEYLQEELTNYPEIVSNTECLLANCTIDFSFKGNQKSGAVNQNKQLFTASKEKDSKMLRDLCYRNLAYRYPDPVKQEANKERLEKELTAIQSQGFESYFLINWDMLRFAREQNFFYVGRGSGANSIVAYLLRITDVDPVELDLYFERFINPYRENPPDFDIDFSWRDRDVVIDYLFEKYGGKNQIALLATYNTFSYKSLIRELGKVFGLPKSELDTLTLEKERQTLPDQYVKLIYKYAKYMNGIPNHLSIHAGGIIISEKPIHYFSATSMPPKGYPLVQFDMVHAEDVGLYKFDVLSQRGLGKVKDSLEMVVKSGRETKLDIHDANPFFKDEKIKQLLRTGDTMGCFYVESPAMRMLLKKLKADNYLALVAASSIIRPGVAKSGMMREYIIRSQSGSEEWRESTPKKMQELMEETYGVMVYQEDVIKVAHHFAGLSLGEADVLRRGMSGKFRSRDEFDKVKQKFFFNCKQRGYSDALTQEVWRQTESFAGYAFSKGHSASYAVESYQSLFLKAHYPMEFILGVLNNGGGFYNTEMYFHEARKLGAKIEAPCINRGSVMSVLQDKETIYIGFYLVRDLEQRVIERFINERQKNGMYQSLEDFVNRCHISIEQLSLLIRVGAFRFTECSKQELLWEMHQLLGSTKKTVETRSLFWLESKRFTIPELDQVDYEDAFDQMELLGFPLCSPFQLLKQKPTGYVFGNELLRYLGRNVSVLGYLVTIKNTKTSSKKLMQFGTFVDERGDWIDTVHFPPVVKQYYFRGKGCYLIYGKVVQEFGYATVEVKEMERLEYCERA